MSHEIENMMYVGARPWHTLGRAFTTPPQTVDAALELAGLNWDAHLDQLSTTDGRKVPRFAVIRSTDEAILGNVGDDYNIVQNRDAFRPLEALLAAKLATVETAGSLRGGSRVWMLLKLNKPDSVIVSASDDRVSKYILVAQGHDGSLSWYFGETAIRVVCANTLHLSITGDGHRMLRLRHTANIDEAIKAATHVIETADQRFEKAAEMFRYMATIKITEQQLIDFVNAVFPQPKKKDLTGIPTVTEPTVDGASELSVLLSRPMASNREGTFSADNGTMTEETHRRIYCEIRDLFDGGGKGSDLEGSRGTAWGALNAVTDYTSHHRGRNDENRANNLWFGQIGNQTAAAARAILLP